MAARPELSAAGRIARAHDPDRFLIALFAPACRREALFLLIAFNHELVRALEMPSARSGAGPIAALIRLQWWRELVEGERRRHEIAGPLGDLLDAGTIARETLLGVIEAREEEAEGIGTIPRWEALQLAGPGGMQVAFAEALGERDADLLGRLRLLGAAYGAGGIVRNHRAILRAGRCPLPDDLLFASATSREGLLAADTPGLDPAMLEPLRRIGLDWLAQAGCPHPRRLPRARAAAALAAVLARRDLDRSPGPRQVGPSGTWAPGSVERGLGDRLALTLAWLRGTP